MRKNQRKFLATLLYEAITITMMVPAFIMSIESCMGPNPEWGIMGLSLTIVWALSSYFRK